MSQTLRTKPVQAMRGFMPATHSLTLGAINAAWQDFAQFRRQCWHRWLDLCDELSYALAFYEEWHRRHKF